MKPVTLSILSAALMFTSMAYADSISIVLDSSTLSGAPGDVLSFSGTVTNIAGDPVYLNSDTISLPGFDSSTIDDSPFTSTTPVYLDVSNNSGDIGLFNISVPGSVPDGTYAGTFSIFGGATASSTDFLGAASFNVQVTPATSPAPEPPLPIAAAFASLLLAGSRLRRRPAC